MRPVQSGNAGPGCAASQQHGFSVAYLEYGFSYYYACYYVRRV